MSDNEIADLKEEIEGLKEVNGILEDACCRKSVTRAKLEKEIEGLKEVNGILENHAKYREKVHEASRKYWVDLCLKHAKAH